MKVSFSKSTLPLSVLIRWGLGEPCSHFLIVFKDGLMFQSNLLGTGLDYYPYFQKNEATVVYELDFEVSADAEEKIYENALMNFSHKAYDWAGFCYYFWRALLHKVLKKPFPLSNRWARKDTFLCVGLIKCLEEEGVPDWFRKAIRSVPDLEMISPYDLYRVLKAAQPEAVSGSL